MNSTRIYVGCALIAFIVSIASMPFAGILSKRLGAVSEVGGRHVGKVPIGRLGGIAALFGVVSSIVIHGVVYAPVRHSVGEHKIGIMGLGVALIFVVCIGVWDDIKRLSAIVKMLVQVAAAIVAYYSGFKITGIDLPFFEPIFLGWLGLPLTILWIVGIVNAVNLIDGLDGLAGGVLFFASLVNFVAAFGAGFTAASVAMSSMSGAILGFLFYNWHPAKIYLGDGGAYSFGFILAISGLLAPTQKASTSIALMVPLLAVGLPVFDTLLTMVRRFLTRRGIFSPDRGHLHHILLDAGISHRRVVIGLYGVCCLLCSMSLVMLLHRNRDVGFVLFAVSCIGMVYWGVSVKHQLRCALMRLLQGEVVEPNQSGGPRNQAD